MPNRPLLPGRRSLRLLASIFALFASTCSLCHAASPTPPHRPNIVIILCDDLGWGDVRCYNPSGKIATPHFDKLASEGTRFMDAHSSSAVCTPSRYSLLTGRYNWRSSLQSGVLNGTSPRLIEAGRETIAAFLKKSGYRTACIGKWHLGLDWAATPGTGGSTPQRQAIDFGRPFSNGPTSLGFDIFFGISASLDMPPYAFLSQDSTTEQPTETRDFPWIAPSASTKRTRKGPAAPGFDAADVLPELTKRAVAFINEAAPDAKRGKPFFLYLPLPSPHTPILPLKEWQGRSLLTPYGDFVMQTDAAVGRVLEALAQSGIENETLVIATSDNGCSPAAEMSVMLEHGHKACAHWRGAKADVYEGGHRVPFIVRWPGRVGVGNASDALVGLQDCFATIAEILGTKYSDSTAEDSISFLPAATGRSKAGRDHLVHHSINGSFAIRLGHWKLALCPGSGGWSFPRPGQDDTSALPRMQLFDLTADPEEKSNVQAANPGRVKEMTLLLERIVADGRSTPGIRQSNTTTVDIWRGVGLAEKSGARRKNTP